MPGISTGVAVILTTVDGLVLFRALSMARAEIVTLVLFVPYVTVIKLGRAGEVATEYLIVNPLAGV